ncbi:MAG: NAD(P)H-dependent oxidoreductase [Lentisphaeraceae bacterium]|nr:NAD(P)H-dependent oxidoreductase [Lentisphaeraceae bacterium]
MAKIIILVASKGMNVVLGDKLAEEVKAQGATPEIINLVDLELALYPAKCETSKTKAIELTEQVKTADGLLFVAPEYNGSLPPVLNNAMAWISTSTEEWRETFNGKAAAIATHSGGGGAHVLVAMRQQLSYIGANVVGREILTHYKKELNPESATEVVGQLLKYANA